MQAQSICGYYCATCLQHQLAAMLPLTRAMAHLCLQLVVGLADAGTVERVGLNDVCTTLQVCSVDLMDHVRAREHQHVIVALELVAVAPVAVTTEVVLLRM